MKKSLFALLLFCLTPFTYAAYGSIIFSENEDEDHAMRMVYEIQSMHEKKRTFKHLELIHMENFWFSIYSPDSKEVLKNFELSTEKNNEIAIIKYQAKDCNNFKETRDKLISLKVIDYSDYISCSRNQFVAWINKKHIDGIEYEEDKEDEEKDLVEVDDDE